MSFRVTVIAGLVLGLTPALWAQGVSSPPIQIAGDERLAWDQVRSAVDGDVFQFVLYVDGVARLLERTSCAPSTAELLTCTTALPALSPGAHVLQVSAILTGLESERSESMTVVITGNSPMIETRASTPASRTRAPSICASSGGPCYLVTPVVASDQTISDVAVAGEDRIFFVEGGRHVRIVDNGRLVPEPALTVDRPADRIIALGVDAAFSQTRIVSAAWLDESVPGAPMLSVARFREVNNILGQRSIIISRLPVSSSSEPQVAWDAAGEVFVALPASSPYEVPQPYGGALLRFASDGTVPKVSSQKSPVFAQAFHQPTAIAVDPLRQGVWVADVASGDSQLAFVSQSASVQIAPGSADHAIVSVSVGDSALLVVDEVGDLHGIPGTAPTVRSEGVAILGDDQVLEIVAVRGGAYAVIADATGTSRVHRLVKLAFQ